MAGCWLYTPALRCSCRVIIFVVLCVMRWICDIKLKVDNFFLWMDCAENIRADAAVGRGQGSDER